MKRFTLFILFIISNAPVYSEENLSLDGIWKTERPTNTWGQFKLKLEDGKYTYWYWSDNVKAQEKYPVTGTYSLYNGVLYLKPKVGSAKVWSMIWVPYLVNGRNCMITTESYYLVDTGTEKIEDQHYLCKQPTN